MSAHDQTTLRFVDRISNTFQQHVCNH